ncbi:MAG: hypothetical protein ALAOOOJD_02104 [bacterium]|nr:hypothetical protein [bacterium]
MSIFDLLFILLFLTSVITLAFAALAALRGRRTRAMAILRRYAIGAAIYLGIVLIVSLAAPRRLLRLGEPLCFDDWCITVENIERTVSPSEANYIASLHLANRARRVAQSENELVIYLSDTFGRRYDPLPDSTAIPLNVLLQPQESVTTRRTFKVPAGATVSDLVIAHERKFPVEWFIIGGGPFRKEPLVRIDAEKIP